MTGVVLFGTLALCLILGVPIAMSLGVASVATVFLSDLTVSLYSIAQSTYRGLESVSIMAIAFFVLAGNLMSEGGISRRLVDFANSIIGGVRGGMAMALVLACAFFAALSGSAPATVLAIGYMLYEDMVRIGYPKDRTAGLLVVAGGMGPIIPPSIIMVVYGTMTGASIAGMFTSGMFVGIVIMLVLMAEVFYFARKEQWPKAVTKLNARDFFLSFFKAIPALMTPIIILGGIYSGILTPTEASAVSVVWSFIAGAFIYRELKVKDLGRIILDSAKGAAMILFIIGTSTAFSWLFTYAGISKLLVDAILGMNLNSVLFCVVVGIILLIFGTFLEGIAIALLMVPILYPIATAMGIHPIHFGMIVCVANVVGTMTPPVAVNIFSAVKVSGLKIGEIAKGQMPFFIGYVAVFFAVVLIPAFSTWMLG